MPSPPLPPTPPSKPVIPSPSSNHTMLLQHALWYAKKGLFVIPLCWPVWDQDELCFVCGCGRCKSTKDVGKRPLLGSCYQTYRADQEQIRKWWSRWPSANIGILLEPSELLVVDLDSQEAREEVQQLGIYLTRVASTAKGLHYYYKRPKDCPAKRRIGLGQSGAIDILSKGYIVAPPSQHQSGHRYSWRSQRGTVSPPTWAVEALQETAPSPSSSQTLLSHPTSAMYQTSTIPLVIEPNPFPLPPTPGTFVGESEVTYVAAAAMTTSTTTTEKKSPSHREEEDIWDALGWIPAEDYELWLRVGMALHYWDHRGEGRGRGRLLWDRWSEWGCPYKFNHHTQETTWRSLDPDKGVRLQTLFHLASEYKNSFRFAPGPIEHQIALYAQREERQEGKQQTPETPKTPETRETRETTESRHSQEKGILQVGLLRLHKQEQRASLDQKSVALTASELEILELLMEQPGHTIPFQSFIKALYSHHDNHIQLNIKESLRQHVCRLRNKLEEIDADRDSIGNVRGHGYRLQLSPTPSNQA